MSGVGYPSATGCQMPGTEGRGKREKLEGPVTVTLTKGFQGALPSSAPPPQFRSHHLLRGCPVTLLEQPGIWNIPNTFPP